jgi:hypothetical protein
MPPAFGPRDGVKPSLGEWGRLFCWKDRGPLDRRSATVSATALPATGGLRLPLAPPSHPHEALWRPLGRAARPRAKPARKRRPLGRNEKQSATKTARVCSNGPWSFSHRYRRSAFCCSKISRPCVSIKRNATASRGHRASRAARIASPVSNAPISTSWIVPDRPTYRTRNIFAWRAISISEPRDEGGVSLASVLRKRDATVAANHSRVKEIRFREKGCTRLVRRLSALRSFDV